MKDVPILLLILLVGLTLTGIVQVVYHIIFLKLYFYKSKVVETEKVSYIPMSVVIPIGYIDDTVYDNIEQMLTQEYPNDYEVVLVDYSLDDNAHFKLKELVNTYPHLNVIILAQLPSLMEGIKFPISIAIKSCKYEKIAVVSAFCVPTSKQWLQSVALQVNDSTDMIIGYAQRAKQKGMWQHWMRFEHCHHALLYLSFCLLGGAYRFSIHNWVISKSLFLEHKGFSSFNNKVGGEDSLFIQQIAKDKKVEINIEKNTFVRMIDIQDYEKWWAEKKREFMLTRFYTTSVKYKIGLYVLAQIVFFVLFIVILVYAIISKNKMMATYIAFVICVKYIIHTIIYYVSFKKLDDKKLWKHTWWMGIFLPIFYIRLLLLQFKKVSKYWKLY